MSVLLFTYQVCRCCAPIAFAMLAAACSIKAEAQAPVRVTPVAASQARVWFYRVFFPEDTGGMPAVAMNGKTVGYARAGWSFYRDVPAGAYHVTVESFIQDPSQAEDIVLAPGQQIDLAIQSDPGWISNLGGFRRGTYYVGIEPARIAEIHLSQTQFGDGY